MNVEHVVVRTALEMDAVLEKGIRNRSVGNRLHPPSSRSTTVVVLTPEGQLGEEDSGHGTKVGGNPGDGDGAGGEQKKESQLH